MTTTTTSREYVQFIVVFFALKKPFLLFENGFQVFSLHYTILI